MTPPVSMIANIMPQMAQFSKATSQANKRLNAQKIIDLPAVRSRCDTNSAMNSLQGEQEEVCSGQGFGPEKVQCLRFEVYDSRFKDQSSKFKVQGLRFKVQGSRFEV